MQPQDAASVGALSNDERAASRLAAAANMLRCVYTTRYRRACRISRLEGECVNVASLSTAAV